MSSALHINQRDETIGIFFGTLITELRPNHFDFAGKNDFIENYWRVSN